MKKINILESLLAIDKKSSNRYELSTLYEACKLKDEDKYQLVKYIDSYEHPSLIGEFLKSKCDGICESVCDDDDVDGIKLIDDINTTEAPAVSTFDLLDMIDDECENALNESVVNDDSKSVRKYVWNKIQTFDSLTDDDSYYWDFDQGVLEGDNAKIITDETDIPDSADYRFSLVEVSINMYYSWDESCWYILDKTYEAPVVEESFETHNCPVCGRGFVDGELGNDCCPKCGEKLHKTDSGEYELTDKDIDEDLQKDLERRYTISDAHTSKGVLSNIEQLKASELIKSVEPDVKYGTEVFVMTATDGRVFYLVPSTMSQFDVYDANEELITKSEFTKYIVDEVIADKSNLEFVYEVVGGDCAGNYSREELEALPCFSGKYTDDQSDIRVNGGFTSRKELDNQPKLNGYVGPMMDGWRNHKMVLRYETQEIYNRLSEEKNVEEAFSIESNWSDYCPHCTNRSLQITDEHNDIAKCSSCGQEYQVVPMANGKVKIVDLDEGFLDDVKKVGKTVKDVAKDRWNDSYTKAIATGVKKNFEKSRLGQDLKKIGDSVKETDTYQNIKGKVDSTKQFIKDNKADATRKASDMAINVRGKNYRVSDLKYKLGGKPVSADEVAQMNAFKRKKVQMIVPRGTKPIKEDVNELSYTHLKSKVANLAETTGLNMYVTEPEEDKGSVELWCEELFDIEGTGLIDVIEYEDSGYSFDADNILEYLSSAGLYSEDDAEDYDLDESKCIKEDVEKYILPLLNKNEGSDVVDDEAFTKEEVIAQLKAELPNLGNEGVVRYGFISEAEVARDFLTKYYALAELDSVGSWFQIDYADPFKNEAVIQMTADEMKDKFGTDNPDIINCGRPEEDGTIELKKSENDTDDI